MDTGWKSPTATGLLDNEWTNPTNAYNSNDNYASAVGTYLEQDYYNFDFGLPAGAIPTGIQVKIEGNPFWDNSSARDSRILVYIWSAGSSPPTWNREESAAWWSFGSPNGDTTLIKPAGTTDLWGTVEKSDFDNSNFKLRISTFSNSYGSYIDWIQVKVYYYLLYQQNLSSQGNIRTVITYKKDLQSKGNITQTELEDLKSQGNIFIFQNTGWKSPTTTGAEWDTWTNPTNAYSSDDAWASRVDDGVRSQGYGGFNFGIPEGAIIDGVEIKIEGYASEDGLYLGVQMYRNSGPAYPSKDGYLDIAESTETYGGSSDTWGHEWIVNDFSNDNFIAAPMTFGGIGGTLYVDHIQVKIYYTVLDIYQKDLQNKGNIKKIETEDLKTQGFLRPLIQKDLKSRANLLSKYLGHLSSIANIIVGIRAQRISESKANILKINQEFLLIQANLLKVDFKDLKINAHIRRTFQHNLQSIGQIFGPICSDLSSKGGIKKEGTTSEFWARLSFNIFMKSLKFDIVN